MQTEVISEGKIQEKRGISSAVLKNIAVVTMLIDHIGAVIVTRLLIRNGLYEAMANQEAYTCEHPVILNSLDFIKAIRETLDSLL